MSNIPLYPPGSVSLKDLLAKPSDPKYIHLTIYKLLTLSPETYPTLTKCIEFIAIDWVKYATENWILYTRDTPTSLYQRLIKDVPAVKSLNILTFYFDNVPSKSGQLQPWIWDWMNKKR